MQKFQRHLSEDHKRKMNETEKEVITYISYEGNSTWSVKIVNQKILHGIEMKSNNV